MKIAYQGIAGSYSESCAKEKYPNCETIACKTFDECFEKANNDNSIKAIIPESNKTTGNIGVEYLIFKYRLNIFAEHFFPINHNLLGLPGFHPPISYKVSDSQLLLLSPHQKLCGLL